ncbi:MAG: hypothetical protein LC808_10300 [Actinobacteria bacterium]|nr:hypothetical protein [Actinomycetota bacterium]
MSSEMDENQHRRARTELDERYGVTWHDERIPEVRTRFGIGSQDVSGEPVCFG